MRDLFRFVHLVEFSAFDRFPLLTWLWIPPIDFVGVRCAEDLRACRPVGQIAAEFLVDVEIPGRVGIEASEDGLLVATILS
mgnify:CR=1 FL=1